MPTFTIRHRTLYRYKSPVALGEHRMLLRPRESFDQTVRAFEVSISPEPERAGWFEDPAGNLVGWATFARRTRELSVEMRAVVSVRRLDPAALRLEEHAGSCPFSYGLADGPALARFMERRQPDPDHAVDGWARSIWAEDPERGSWSFLCRLNERIRRDFAYLRREEKGVQDAPATLKLRRGSCRDFAILMAEAVRSLGFAARFVSGYLHVHGRGPAVAQAGGSTHAWIQVFLPGGGWIDFDPTSGAVGNGDLVRVAAVRDPEAASPLSGSFMGFPDDEDGMSVDVAVERFADSCASSGNEIPLPAFSRAA